MRYRINSVFELSIDIFLEQYLWNQAQLTWSMDSSTLYNDMFQGWWPYGTI